MRKFHTCVALELLTINPHVEFTSYTFSKIIVVKKAMKSLKTKSLLPCIILSGGLFLFGCKKDDQIIKPANTVKYKVDGRTVKYGDPLPIAIDLTEDGKVDYTIFVELTANGQGDRLFAGMNPIGENLIKSGPAIDENFLNMGLLIAETPAATIDFNVRQNQQWTPDFGALVVRNTFTNGKVSYEGNWADSEQIVGIQHRIDQAVYFGWLRIRFDKKTEIVTLVDYAYEATASKPIKAGYKSNDQT
jgi:hypothetical protein